MSLPSRLLLIFNNFSLTTQPCISPGHQPLAQTYVFNGSVELSKSLLPVICNLKQGGKMEAI